MPNEFKSQPSKISFNVKSTRKIATEKYQKINKNKTKPTEYLTYIRLKL